MPTLVQARTDDEIADVIEKVRAANDPEVGLVLPRGSRALQTPLNARLLSQFSKREGRRTAIVSDEPRVQELARANGFPVYASVSAFERGIELGAVMAGAGTASRAAGSRAFGGAAVQEPPARTATAFGPPSAATAVATRPDVRRPLPPGPPQPSRWRDRRRPLYFAGAAAAVIGLLLFFTLAPSARITVTVAGTQLSRNATIQGSTDASAANQGDHILTAVLNAQAAGSFQATPSGTATLPATAATATLTFSWSGPAPQTVYMPQGQVFETADHAVSFVSTQTTTLCLGPNSQPANQGDCGSVAPNNQLAVQDGTAEAKGNVPANSITAWPQDPCSPSNYDFGQCQGPGHDFHVTNAAASSGGADARQVTVASSTDVSNWNAQATQIEQNLTNQVNSQMQSMASGRTFAVDPGGGGKSIQFQLSPNLPNAGDQFSASTVNVTAQATAAVYNPVDVRNDIIADLNSEVAQGDELAPGKLNMQPCQVTQAATDGTVILSCAATDFAQPVVNLSGLKSQLAGKNPGDAQKIIESSIDKVQSVTVSEFPFRLFYLPFFSSRIEIDENFIAAS